MIVAKIQVNGAIAKTVYRKVIPAGIIGAQVEFDYDEDIWHGLRKTVVFKGAVTKDVVTDANIVTIPHEVVEKPFFLLSIGVYGVNADGNIVIPTLWENIGAILDAAAPSGDISTDPSLPVWAQIQAMNGNLDDLTTEAKNNLVAAVNEVKHTADSKQDTLIQSGASIGQIVKISAVDDTGKPTAWEAINIPEQAQPDWNQNDSTQPDYVKNRPFYTGTKIVTVENATDTDFVLEGFPVFVVGDTVTVSVDGVEHSLVAYDDNGYVTIGDTSSSIENGEGQLGWQVYVEEDGLVWFLAKEAHTVSYVVSEVVKIDKKYLPDDASDMKIRYSSADNSCAIVHGTYAEVVNKIINDVYPIVYVIVIYNNNKTVYSTTAHYYNTNIIEIIGGGYIFNVYPDNTIVLSD